MQNSKKDESIWKKYFVKKNSCCSLKVEELTEEEGIEGADKQKYSQDCSCSCCFEPDNKNQKND